MVALREVTVVDWGSNPTVTLKFGQSRSSRMFGVERYISHCEVCFLNTLNTQIVDCK